MRILLSNDDGFDAPGIHALAREIRKIGDVFVSAPAEPQSGKSHGVTVAGDVKVKHETFEDGIDGFRVWGTPYDASSMAIRVLLPALHKEKPDLLITGINHGSNVGFDTLHSGTVGSASAGLFFGIPVIAMSLNGRMDGHYDYSYAAKYSAKAAKWFIKQPFNRDFTLNVNVPNIPDDAIKGTIITRMSRRHNYIHHYDLKQTADGASYAVSVVPNHDDKGETLFDDDYAVNHGYVTITPLAMDVTDYSAMPELLEAADGALNAK